MTKEQVELITKLYNQGLSARAIKAYVPYTEHTILNHLAKNGVSIRSKAGYRPPFNERYFENIDTELKAYFLGYLMADGNVSERKQSQPVIRMELNQRDKYVLEKLKEELGTSINVKDSHKNGCVLRIHSQAMFDDLSKYGIVPRKTGIEKFPIDLLPSKLIRHFVRGFFDGDGWVTITHHGSKSYVINSGFCGNHQMLSEISDFLNKEINCYNMQVTDREGVSQIIYGSKSDNIALYHYMYDNSTFYLKRKKDKFDLFFHANIEQPKDHSVA